MRRATFPIPGGASDCRGSRFPAGIRAPSGSDRSRGSLKRYIDRVPLEGPLLTDRELDINKTKNDINKLKAHFILCILTFILLNPERDPLPCLHHPLNTP